MKRAKAGESPTGRNDDPQVENWAKRMTHRWWNLKKAANFAYAVRILNCMAGTFVRSVATPLHDRIDT